MKATLEIILKAPKNLSEIGTIFHLIIPLFNELGWNIGMVENIIFEDTTATKKRVDIKFTTENGSFFLEAKRVGVELSIKDFEQLTTYLNSDQNTDIGILTNGIDYWIADNTKNGLEDKKIYHFSLDEVTDCNLEVLEIFKYPLSDLKNLTTLIDFQTNGKKLGKISCENLHKSGKEKTSYSPKKIEKQSDIPSLKVYLELEEFKPFSKFFQKKIEIAVDILEKNSQDLNQFFKSIGRPFMFEKPIRHHFVLNKYNIFVDTNTNTATKRGQLKNIEDYLKNSLKG